MQARAEYAAYVEPLDFIVIDGEVVGYVKTVTDEGDFIHLNTVDEDGDQTTYAFAPFDHVDVVESFDEDGSVPDEWEHFYAEGGTFDQLR